MPGRVLALLLLGLLAAAVALGGAASDEASAGVCGAVAALGLAASASPRLRAAPGDARAVALAWGVLLLGSTLWSVAPDASLDAITPWIASLVVFVLAAGGLRGRGRDAFALGLAVLGAAVACFALAAAPVGGRARAPFGNPNHLAAWLLLPAALAACEVVRTNLAARGRRERALLWFGLFGISGAAVAATQSLGAGLAALGAMLALAWLRTAPPVLATRSLALGWLVVAFALALAPALAPALVLPHDGMDESSPGLRWQVYGAAAQLAWNAFPFGVGPGAFGAAFASVRPAGLPYAVDHAHGDALQGAVELGLPLVVLGLASAALIARRAASALVHERFAWSAATALVALALHALVEFPLHVPALALTGAALAGAVWSAWAAAPHAPAAPHPAVAPSGARALRRTRFALAALSLALAGLAGTLHMAVRAEREAASLLAAGRFAEAEALAAAALRARPVRPALWSLVAEAREAQARLVGDGDVALASAVAARRSAVYVAPLDAGLRIALAETRARAGDLVGALASQAEAVRLDPASPAARIGEARLLLAAGRRADAADAVHAALERHPRAADGLLDALLRATGDPELVALASPDFASTRRSAGRVLGRAGFSRLAARALARSLEIEPGDPEIALEAARHFARSGDPAGAEAVLVRALSRGPDDRLSAEIERLRGKGGTS